MDKKDYQLQKLTKRSNLLELQSAELQILKENDYFDVKISTDALEGWIELSLKVSESTNEEAREWYKDRLTPVHTLIRRHDKVLFSLKKLETDYESLYKTYDDLFEKYLELNNKYNTLAETF